MEEAARKVKKAAKRAAKQAADAAEAAAASAAEAAAAESAVTACRRQGCRKQARAADADLLPVPRAGFSSPRHAKCALRPEPSQPT